MTRFALLPPDIQALERRRIDLSRRIGFLSPHSHRGRALRREQLALTAQIVALEARLDGDITATRTAEKSITEGSRPTGDEGAFKYLYWWEKL